MTQEVKLNRTDKRPLAFFGTEIAHASNKQRGSSRWINIRVFKAVNGGFVIGIGRLTCFMGERDQLSAEVVTSLKDVIAMVRKEVPELADLIGAQLDRNAPWKREAACMMKGNYKLDETCV